MNFHQNLSSKATSTDKEDKPYIYKALQSNTTNIISFDSDSVNVFLDTCVTKALTGFKSDFIKGTFQEIDLRRTDTILGSTELTRRGTVIYNIPDDNRKTYPLKLNMNYLPTCKYRLISP